MKNGLFWLLLLAMIGSAAAQDNRTLFSVAGKPVSVDEFTYIYSKTNGNQADFSKASLEEYLDLYIKFKLKVARAMDMRLDTIQALQQELAGYRRQLADSYLIDRSVTDALVKEAYERVQEDIDISHILFTLGKNPAPEDTLLVRTKVLDVMKQIAAGDLTFEAAAEQYSADRFSKSRGGRVGYINALFPKGLHRLEDAAYSAPMDQIVGPVRSMAGYHILKVNDKRPARGEMEVRHILIRKGDAAAAERTRIDSAYQALQKGADFEQLAKAVSQDDRTKDNGGYLGFFGINKYERSFEDAAFALKADGDYTQPIQTAAGWHIVQRVSRQGIQPFAIEKARLEQQIRTDERFAEAKTAMLERIRKESNYRLNEAVYNDFVQAQTDTFFTFRWRAPETPSTQVLFTLGKDYKVTLGDFTEYLSRASRARSMAARAGSMEAGVAQVYDQFVDDQLLKYEETQLEKKYPEFKALMREYEEGILLFEATRMEVWDKAAQDSAGLEKFYKTIEGKYRWPERAKGTLYQVGMSQQGQLVMIRDYAERHDRDDVLRRFNTEEQTIVTAKTETLEQTRLPGSADWKVGAVSEAKENKRSKSLTFFKIEEILPPAPKTLGEARGYVVADYQDELERRWIEALRKDYEIKVNDKVLKSLIK